MIEVSGKYTTAKIMIDEIEPVCLSQIHKFLNHPAFTNPVAIMPDTHAGKGSVIGFTMKMGDKVIPNTIGVDISCAIRSVHLGQILIPSISDLDKKIRQNVPFGKNVRETTFHNYNTFFRRDLLITQASYIKNLLNSNVPIPDYDEKWFKHKCEKEIGIGVDYALCSLGSLGGGNHFIEFGSSPLSDTWYTIHTGSRNFGYKICSYWQKIASKEMMKKRTVALKERIEILKTKHSGEELGKKVKELKVELGLDNVQQGELDYLEGDNVIKYLYDMIFASTYANVNRTIISIIIDKILGKDNFHSIETVHNYIDFQDLIIRKGAVRSYIGEKFILPFNQEDGLLICEGKSNPEWNFSAPHGSGRALARGVAKRTLDLKVYQEGMKNAGVYSSSIGMNTLDESKAAYKDSAMIEKAIEPTATIIDRIKPFLNLKDGGND